MEEGRILLINGGKNRDYDGNLAAVISSQTVRQDNGETSGKQDAIAAKSDQHKFFACRRRACPGLGCLSHSAIIPNSSAGVYIFSSGNDVPFFFSPVSELEEELNFFLDCILFRSVSMWVFRRASPNSFDA